MTTVAPKFAVGAEVKQGAQTWKITKVYGFRPAYCGVVYAGVRYVKSTQKWSGVEYLLFEERLEG